MTRKIANRKRGRIRYYSIGTRLNYKDRNSFLKYCRKAQLTPSEVIRLIINDKIKEVDNG